MSFTINVNTQIQTDLDTDLSGFFFFFSVNLEITLWSFPASAADFVTSCVPAYKTGFTFSDMMRCRCQTAALDGSVSHSNGRVVGASAEIRTQHQSYCEITQKR